MAAEKFESSLKKLEEVVKRLESGELSLDEALKAFEEGVRHAGICSSKLNEAEKKVELLLKQKDGSFRTELFKSED
jgi:exodeoxyribonuclease VII small subunit